MAKTYLMWDPVEDNIVREYDDGGVVTAEYTTEPELYGNVISQRRQGQYRQFHYDGQGSTLAATDENQNVTDTFAYTAFGEVTERTGASEIPFQYIGQKGYYVDRSTTQYLIRQRPYDPARARWLTVDPLRLSVANVSQHLNVDKWPSAYLYGTNRATYYTDPSGLVCINTGPLYYQSCGKAQWKAVMLLTTDEEKKGGFIIQRVTQVFDAYNCCDNVPRYQGVAKCGKYFTDDVSERDTLVYWELIDMHDKVRSPVDTFQLEAFTPSVGGFFEEGVIWFHPGDSPPDGWEKWKIDPKGSAPTTPSRCDRPTGDPKATDVKVSRQLHIGWDCCFSKDPSKQVEAEGKPVPGTRIPTIELPKEGFTKVMGACM